MPHPRLTADFAQPFQSKEELDKTKQNNIEAQ